ncbi:MAG: ParD-like family protein [Actinobacteria bacterium]|nr:ParD-like family protein [Actinomycetota bacterium]
MSTAIKISKDIAEEAKLMAKITRRSMAGQVEYWAFIGKIAEENPDLSFLVIKDILLGRQQLKEGLGTPYIFGEGEKSR